MASLKDLQLKNDVIDTGHDLDSLPEQFGSFADPPQPGPFRVRMPTAGALAECWETLETQRGQRVVAVLRDNAALTIIQSPAGRYNGEPLSTRISNAERKRGKDENSLASDMDYLLAATKYQGKRPKTNQEYIAAFQALAGKEFGFDWEFSWFCNENKPIRVEDPQNGTVLLDGKEGRQEQKGCGTRFYMKDVDKQPNEKGDMEYPVRIDCGNCGAVLRAYGQIARFRE